MSIGPDPGRPKTGTGKSGASFSSRSADWRGDSPPSRLVGLSVPGDQGPQLGGRRIRVNSAIPVQPGAGRVDEAIPDPEREAGEMTVPGSIRQIHQIRRVELVETEESGRFADDRPEEIGGMGDRLAGGVVDMPGGSGRRGCGFGGPGLGFPMSLIIEIPDSVVDAMRVPRPERESRVKADLACALYAGEVLPLGKAAELAGLDKFQFGVELGKRKISRHYDESCLAEDLADAHG